MTERQKKEVAKSYYSAYLTVCHRIEDVKKATEHGIEGIESLLWAANELKTAKAELDGRYRTLCSLRLAVMVSKDNEATLLDITDLRRGESEADLIDEFLANKIIIERGE